MVYIKIKPEGKPELEITIETDDEYLSTQILKINANIIMKILEQPLSIMLIWRLVQNFF